MPIGYLKETPSQTAGPFVHIGTLPAFAGLELRTQEQLHVLGGGTEARIRIEGVIFDGAGAPLRDALIEIWQADAQGRYDSESFRGWGRGATDGQSGLWHFETLKPGATPWKDGRPQAPHVSLLIFARGINIHLHTRMYFPEDGAAHAADPVLCAIEPRHRVATLLAQRQDGEGPPVYRFDIRLQGEGETVFFDM